MNSNIFRRKNVGLNLLYKEEGEIRDDMAAFGFRWSDLFPGIGSM